MLPNVASIYWHLNTVQTMCLIHSQSHSSRIKGTFKNCLRSACRHLRLWVTTSNLLTGWLKCGRCCTTITPLPGQSPQTGSHPADQTLQHEESWTSYLLAQIQAALQAAGQTLGKSRKLNSVADSKRACFLQTRFYLAILYSHLYHYNLSAAQGLCDHLAREVLRRSQLYSDDIETFTVDECHVPETWLIKDVHSETACAVIQSMARFMAAYFTNQPLYVLPPHNVDILSPLQSKPGTFRELCSLCWMFHDRERLSASCRKYQLARNSARDPEVAEVLVKVFPEQEESVRVPLREKYNCLLQSLRHSTVKGPEREMMSVVIQDLLKQRCKQLKRIARNIGPVEFHIWERAEEGVAENDNPLCDRFSLGTSLSQSTLTDFGRPQVYSDDTADTISEQLQGEDSRDEVNINESRHSKPQSMELMPDKKKVSDKPNRKLKLNAEKVEGHVLDFLALPVVGSWEFECDDDEYVRFLELFLSFMLEKGLVNNKDPGIHFLACFSSRLQEHELNSLLFDVHTTLKRQQLQKGSSNIFRAGRCYHLVPGPPPAPLGKPVSVHSET
ncbi:UNVERIFIED_CONTAM: hypothetical protein FKN15_005583 [Acipenser sinensis]